MEGEFRFWMYTFLLCWCICFFSVNLAQRDIIEVFAFYLLSIYWTWSIVSICNEMKYAEMVEKYGDTKIKNLEW